MRKHMREPDHLVCIWRLDSEGLVAGQGKTKSYERNTNRTNRHADWAHQAESNTNWQNTQDTCPKTSLRSTFLLWDLYETYDLSWPLSSNNWFCNFLCETIWFPGFLSCTMSINYANKCQFSIVKSSVRMKRDSMKSNLRFGLAGQMWKNMEVLWQDTCEAYERKMT